LLVAYRLVLLFADAPYRSPGSICIHLFS
jgi:hypothetical protein